MSELNGAYNKAKRLPWWHIISGSALFTIVGLAYQAGGTLTEISNAVKQNTAATVDIRADIRSLDDRVDTQALLLQRTVGQVNQTAKLLEVLEKRLERNEDQDRQQWQQLND